MNAAIAFLVVDLVYTYFFVGQDFVASMMSIIKALTVASSFFHVIVASFLGIFVPRLVLLLTRVFMT